MAWTSVRFYQNTSQEKLGAATAIYEHATLGQFTYKEDRIDMVGKYPEFVERAKASLQEWIDSQSKYSDDEASILEALNQ